MNMNQLKYLRTVIQEGSYADAARLLFISPQAVSKSVKALEEELGIPLFKKEGRSIIPTEFGKRFSLQAEDALRIFDDLSAYAQGCTALQIEPRRILLAAVVAPYRCRVFLNGDFDRFRLEHPTCRLDIRFLANENCAVALESSVVDAALVQGRIDKKGIECHRVGELRPYAVMRRGTPLSGKRRLRFADLDGIPIARPFDMRCAMSLLKRGCRLRRVSPCFVDLAPSFESGSAFIEQGGIVLASRTSAFSKLPGAIAVPFDPEEGLLVPLYLAYAAEKASGIAALYTYIADIAKRDAKRRKQATPRPNL